jgi:hypothetical protein
MPNSGFTQRLQAWRHDVAMKVRSRGGARVIAVSAIVGLILFVLESFAGNLVTDVLRYLGRRIPEVAQSQLGYSLLALFVWIGVWVPVVLALAYFDTRPQRRWAEALKERTRLEAQVGELEKDRNHWRESAEEWYQQLHYGTSLLNLPRLDEVDHRVMSNRLHELRPKFDASVRAMQGVWADLGSAAAAEGEGCPYSWLHVRVDQTEAEHTVTVVKTLWTRLDRGEEPRPLLYCAYTRYAAWHECVLRLAYLLNVRTERMASYPEWFDAERTFLGEFRSCLQIPQLKPIQQEVAMFDMKAAPKTLPPPAQL